MWSWLTLIIASAASVILADYRMKGEWPGFVKLIISIAVETIIFFLLEAVLKAVAFPVALLMGQIVCFMVDIRHRNSGILLMETFIYLSYDMIWLPLYLCNDAVWQYAIYLAVVVLCLSLVPVNMVGNEAIDIWQISPDIINSEKTKHFLLVSVLPCVMIAPEILFLVAIHVSMGSFSILSALLLCSAFVLLYILVLLLQWETAGRFVSEDLNDAMSRWQQDSRDYMNTIRSQRHDFNLHLHAISGLINSGEYEKCREYAKKLVTEANAVNDIMPLSDAVVGSMLYNMREEARKQGSDITYHITYDMEDILCNGFECNKIIGNLLQNAIDALQTPEDKAFGIHLSIFKRRGNTVIISENRFSGDPNRIARVFEAGYSTKRNHEGIGLSMVLRTAERYGGRVYPEFEKDKIRFVVNIPNKVHLPQVWRKDEHQNNNFG